jgi:hypothetical protein
MIEKQPGLWIYPDGREVIQRDAAGGKILAARWRKAWRESDGICCLCQQKVLFAASLEHKTAKGAGGATHDDRQSNLGISHRPGNIAKGSMSLEQYLKLDPAVRIRNCQSA